MNTTKKILLTILLVFVFSTVLAMATATTENSNKGIVDNPPQRAVVAKDVIKAAFSTNSSFVTCMKNAVDVKQTSYDAAKATKKTCLETASSSNSTDVKKEAGKNCSSEFKKSMKEAKKVFVDARNECKTINHTAWEGFKAYFQ